MSTDVKRKNFLHLERERLTRFQHQHRGLNFLKLWLPPSTDRKVNVIGLNHHIYKGKIPTVPIDQLPPEVDPKSIDEEQLYKEIRDMRFPIVPPLQPLGPTRRIGGEYTTVKRMTFAPVQISLDEDRSETPILGVNGKVYQGRTTAIPMREMDRKLRGTKRPAKNPPIAGSSRGTVNPTVVSLHVDGKPPSERKPPVPLIQLPYADLNKLIKLMEIKSHESVKDDRGSEQVDEKPSQSKVRTAEERDPASTEGEFTASQSVEETDVSEGKSISSQSVEGTDVSEDESISSQSVEATDVTDDESISSQSVESSDIAETTGTSSEVMEPVSEESEGEESEPEENA